MVAHSNLRALPDMPRPDETRPIVLLMAMNRVAFLRILELENENARLTRGIQREAYHFDPRDPYRRRTP